MKNGLGAPPLLQLLSEPAPVKRTLFSSTRCRRSVYRKFAPPPRKCSASSPVRDSYTCVTPSGGCIVHDTRRPRGVRVTVTFDVRVGSSVATLYVVDWWSPCWVSRVVRWWVEPTARAYAIRPPG